jgi:serine/threonine protein kinase
MCYLFIPYSNSCRCHIPGPGVSAIHPNIPAIFNTYRPSFENDGPEHRLQILKPLEGDTRSSVFHVYAENIQPNAPAQAGGNCAAKLAFRHYGLKVHQALAPDFAPMLLGVSSKSEIGASLYLMEYLAPPAQDQEGWVTLGNLSAELVHNQHEEICSALSTFAKHLQSLELVHGDLRPNNIMIQVKAGFEIAVPVIIKVIDFEWADVVHKGRYPMHRNAEVGYPGTPGGLIETSHDAEMVRRCQHHVHKIRSEPLGHNPNVNMLPKM